LDALQLVAGDLAFLRAANIALLNPLPNNTPNARADIVYIPYMPLYCTVFYHVIVSSFGASNP
jgi:hypothetical protein